MHYQVALLSIMNDLNELCIVYQMLLVSFARAFLFATQFAHAQNFKVISLFLERDIRIFPMLINWSMTLNSDKQLGLAATVPNQM